MNAWLQERAPAGGATTRLFCFPPAGAGPAVFRTWAQALAPDVHVVGLRLPGREVRLHEAPATDWTQLVDDVLAALAPRLDLPYVVFGHSFGGMLAYEAVRAVQTRGLPLPARLVLAACRAPHRRPHVRAPYDAPGDELWRWIAALQGTPSLVLQDAALRAAFEPALRADLRLAEHWRGVDATRLDVPLLTIAADADPIVQPADVTAWRPYAARSYEHAAFAGGHFFFQECEDDVLERLSLICRGLAQPASVPC